MQTRQKTTQDRHAKVFIFKTGDLVYALRYQDNTASWVPSTIEHQTRMYHIPCVSKVGPLFVVTSNNYKQATASEAVFQHISFHVHYKYNYKTSISPISSKRIDLSGAHLVQGVGQTHSPGTMQSSSTMIRWKGNLGRISESEKVSF